MPPRFHCTPPETVAETVRETVFVGDYTFRIERPADGDKLLDHPWCRSAYAADEYVPYWPTLWPSARMLAKAVLREPWENYPQPVEVLEVGCGLGLAGVACLVRGLRVTFSDVDETAVAFAVRFAGRGHDGRFAIASAILTVLGCALGNFLTVVVAVAAHDHASYLDVFVGLAPRVVEVMGSTFNIMDVVFYAIGAYFGYKYATRPLRPRVVVPDPTP